MIQLAEIDGPFHLGYTLESGQSYLWRREGGMYQTGIPAEPVWYETVVEGEYIRVRQVDHRLEWESTIDADGLVRRLLRLDDDLADIQRTFPGDQIVQTAYQNYRGMRLVRDPVFPCLISFICSTQMRVPRIHGMQRRLARELGSTRRIRGHAVSEFPDPGTLAQASEADLRGLKLGYRAPYVRETARQVRDGTDPGAAREMDYPEAREFLTQFHGVGPKVADCVCLFALGFTEAVPLDTWIREAIARHFPECDRDSYQETSAAIRTRLGGDYAGYAQTYVFHELRSQA